MVRSPSRVVHRLPAGVVLLLALNLALASTAIAADHAVKIVGFAFAPQTVTVTVGDSVTWTNGDAVTHTATADDASFDTGSIAGGTRSAAVTFNTVGTFAYHCRIHASMTATVVVTDAPPATDTLGPVASPEASTSITLLALVAAGGLVIGLRRFARVVREPRTPND